MSNNGLTNEQLRNEKMKTISAINNIKEETERQLKKDRLVLCLLGVAAMLMICGVIAVVVLS